MYLRVNLKLKAVSNLNLQQQKDKTLKLNVRNRRDRGFCHWQDYATAILRGATSTAPATLGTVTVSNGNKRRELISNHNMQARPLGSPRGLEPIGQPQQAPQQATQIFQNPLTSQPAGQTIPAGIDQNNPGALLAAAREAAGRGDQAMAAALLEAAKQANQRMQMNSGVRAAA